MRRRLPFQRFLLGTCIAAVVTVVISSGPAFTAPSGGDGWNGGRVSGYRIADVHYALDGDRVSVVSFTLDAPARAATARLDDVEAPCTLDGRTATCALETALPVSQVGTLSVEARA